MTLGKLRVSDLGIRDYTVYSLYCTSIAYRVSRSIFTTTREGRSDKDPKREVGRKETHNGRKKRGDPYATAV